MISKKNLLSGLALLALTTVSATYANEENFVCPQPSEIVSTDFTVPSVWTAPAMPRAAKGTVGVGMGGKEAVELIDIVKAKVGHKPGWICVYRSKDGFSINEAKGKVKGFILGHQFLHQYYDRYEHFVKRSEKYTKKYPQDVSIGVIGYQLQK